MNHGPALDPTPKPGSPDRQHTNCFIQEETWLFPEGCRRGNLLPLIHVDTPQETGATKPENRLNGVGDVTVPRSIPIMRRLVGSLDRDTQIVGLFRG